MYKINKKLSEKYYFVKNFISGIKLNKIDIFIIKKKKINFKISFIKIDNNNVFLYFNRRKFFLLLKKKEIFLIKNFINKKYYCIPIKILKINSFFKIKISIVKKKGMKGVDVLKNKIL